MTYQTIDVRFQSPVCFLKLLRPTINLTLLEECLKLISAFDDKTYILIVEGSSDCFCLGADFQGIDSGAINTNDNQLIPERLYDVLTLLAQGDFVSVALVRGKVNAGGIGLVAACDLVLADETAQFSLSELLFDLFPACVLPFLIRRIGRPKANYMSLITKPISVQQASDWGLVDAFEANADSLLRKHLLRLRYLSKTGIQRYKQYLHELDSNIENVKPLAIAANRNLFSNPENLQKISRYVQTGRFPWED